MIRWPATVPADIRTRLESLAEAGKLSGVAPQVLAAICRFTSNYGQPSLGVNATGFGGYFGQHVTWSYPGRPGGFTRTELLTPLMFWAEAQAAAATLASYRLPLGQALSTYATGSVAGWQTSGFVQFVSEATGAAMYGPTAVPTKEAKTMTVGIVDYANAQWCVFVTGGQLKRHHCSGPNEVEGLVALGAVHLSGAPWSDTVFFATIPVV